MTATVADLQANIAEWANSVVPNRTPLSVVAKLLGELGELIASERMGDPSEIADVLILALDLAHLQGIDAAEAIKTKLEVNKSRKWKVADNGCAQHYE
jgi:NTP pyrophosphatase (non-canonical NTP hydrolase)